MFSFFFSQMMMMMHQEVKIIYRTEAWSSFICTKCMISNVLKKHIIRVRRFTIITTHVSRSIISSKTFKFVRKKKNYVTKQLFKPHKKPLLLLFIIFLFLQIVHIQIPWLQNISTTRSLNCSNLYTFITFPDRSCVRSFMH